MKPVVPIQNRDTYDGKELRHEPHRPGATDFLKVPSRFGNTRVPHFTMKEKK